MNALTSYTLRVGLVFALLCALASAVHASCERHERVSRNDAECLEASWTNRGWNKKSSFSVKNLCHRYGSVVAKLDLHAAADQTKTLTTATAVTGRIRPTISDITCCSDLSDLCNKSDVVTAVTCHTRFTDSPGGDSCSSAEALIDTNYDCVINAICPRSDGDGHHDLSITTKWYDTDDIVLCGDELKNGSC